VTTTLRLGGDPTAPRIIAESVSSRALDLLSALMYVAADSVREMYFRFRFPRP
jgi:hypothetical protein